jgi:hypothetical protein
MRNRHLAPALLAATAILVACGGGGGPTPPTGGGGGTPTPTPSPTPSTTTTASGTVVDRDTNAGLGGISVAIAPWVAGATPIPEGTTAPNGTFTFTAANGHYLLYIGSNSTSDTTRATVHDNITLTGGAQALHAPTLPPVPYITPPPSETSGNYRLALLDQTAEVPCFDDFNAARVSNSLPQVVEDEWLTENTREIIAWSTSANRNTGGTATLLTTGNTQAIGGATCTSLLAITIPGSTYAMDARTMWFGGTSELVLGGPQSQGLLEYPIDPRAFTDPNFPNWP